MEASEFMNYKNWAVVGDITNPEKYAHRIFKSLEKAGFKAYGVNPRIDNVNVYKSLKDISEKIDVVDLCISPKVGIDIIKQAHEIGIKYILIQPGAESNEILSYCKDKGIIGIEGCALVELSKYNM
jgi:predicted CoA-binding protein